MPSGWCLEHLCFVSCPLWVLWLFQWKRQFIFPLFTSWNCTCVIQTSKEACCRGRSAGGAKNCCRVQVRNSASSDSKCWRLLDKNDPRVPASSLSSWLSKVVGYWYWWMLVEARAEFVSWSAWILSSTFAWWQKGCIMWVICRELRQDNCSVLLEPCCGDLYTPLVWLRSGDTVWRYSWCVFNLFIL